MVEVKVLAGSKSIGGNFVRIEDGDKIIIFDQGIRFDVMNKFYSGFVTPKSVTELRALGIVPKPEWYEGSNGIYISHMHLDHLGVLSNIPVETEVYLPSKKIYTEMENRWSSSPTWLSLVPGKYFLKIKELKPLEEDGNNVMAIPVSHSAYPSYALLYFGKDETVLYTGDFRVESFLTEDEYFNLYNGQNLLEFLGKNKDVKVDTLVIEGTNFGSDRFPLAPKDAIETMKRLASSHSPLVTTLHGLDLEYTFALMKIASELNLKCYVASEQIASLLETMPKLPVELETIEEYVQNITSFERTTLEEVEEKALYLVSYREIVDFIKDLASFKKLKRNVAAVLSEPEPQVEEASEYNIIANWFSIMGVSTYRVRVSGHYYPYQLKLIMNVIKPKEVKAIHTTNPNFIYNILGK
ncbi:MAG: hypothetical protein ACP5M7_10215 [Thermoproteota archaeon]